MFGAAPRILFIADEVPPASTGLESLLARGDIRFINSPARNALDTIHNEDFAAAIVVASPTHFSGSQQDLVRLLDALCGKHVGVILITGSPEDTAAAERLAGADGVMAVLHTCPLEELAGRLAGLVSARPMIEQLHRENLTLRKFETGLNRQMNQLDEEMRLAARLQADFLPREMPKIDGCGFHVLFRPASYVSGDIYDVSRLDEDHVGFYIADAVGHGMPAALLTIFIKRALKTKEILKTGYRIVPPNEALAALNEDMLSQHLSLSQFVTMAYAVLNVKTLELQFARAGHPLPLHLRAGGQVLELDSDGPLLGVFPGEQFALQRTKLQPGDAVLIYSDGFETAFGEALSDRYHQEFARLSGPHPEVRMAELAALLDQQEGSLHPRDDITALLLAVTGKTSAKSPQGKLHPQHAF